MNNEQLDSLLHRFKTPSVPERLGKRLQAAIARLPEGTPGREMVLDLPWTWTLTGAAVAASTLLAVVTSYWMGHSSVVLDLLPGAGGGLL